MEVVGIELDGDLVEMVLIPPSFSRSSRPFAVILATIITLPCVSTCQKSCDFSAISPCSSRYMMFQLKSGESIKHFNLPTENSFG